MSLLGVLRLLLTVGEGEAGPGWCAGWDLGLVVLAVVSRQDSH